MADHVGDDVDRASVDAADADGLLTEEELGRPDGVAVDTKADLFQRLPCLTADDDGLALVADD